MSTFKTGNAIKCISYHFNNRKSSIYKGTICIVGAVYCWNNSEGYWFGLKGYHGIFSPENFELYADNEQLAITKEKEEKRIALAKEKFLEQATQTFNNQIQTMKTQSLIRDRQGRFAPTRPSTLRRGSLYRVVGETPIVGRFRAPAYGDLVVFSVHDKPVVVAKSAVRKADQSDVQSYLANAK